MSVNGNTSTQSTRPKNSKFNQKFKQQRLPAWQPILTADTVLPAFFLIGLLFVPLGVALLLFSDSVVEMQVDYTDCHSTDSSHRNALGEFLACREVLTQQNYSPTRTPCFCKIPFTVTQSLEKNVYMYYGLDNYYQNHRRYVKSRDDRQLMGKAMGGSVLTDCSPFDKDSQGKIYAPCGAIANSLFNDTLSLFYSDAQRGEQKVPLLGYDIAWSSDKNVKFSNPSGTSLDNSSGGSFENTVQPPYWTKPVWMLDAVNASNNGYENEDLIVWMRTAAFPSFRKLYRRVDHSVLEFKSSMQIGNYTLEVQYNYPVHSFGGRKRMILSTTSFLGGKNNFLGIAYITVGCICFLLGVIFLVIHVKFGERTTKHLNINQNTPFTE